MKDSHKLLPRKQKNKRLVRFAAISAVIFAIAGITTVVLSQDKKSDSEATRQESSKAKKYVATKEIIFDQATGKLRKPTDEETKALVESVSVLTNRSSDGLTINTQPNGMKLVDLEGRFNGVVLGRANADGTTEVRCVFTMEEAAEFLGLQEVPNQ
jgi:hypothetical protein